MSNITKDMIGVVTVGFFMIGVMLIGMSIFLANHGNTNTSSKNLYNEWQSEIQSIKNEELTKDQEENQIWKQWKNKSYNERLSIDTFGSGKAMMYSPLLIIGLALGGILLGLSLLVLLVAILRAWHTTKITFEQRKLRKLRVRS